MAGEGTLLVLLYHTTKWAIILLTRGWLPGVDLGNGYMARSADQVIMSATSDISAGGD